MKIKSPRRIVGPFAAVEQGEGAWTLTTGVPGGNEVYLVGAKPGSAAVLENARFESVALEWREDGVTLTLTAARRETSIWARSVMCHEPRFGLFADLPLATFDAGAQRFWRRIFRLMRIPGGRYLLGFIARVRSRKPTSSAKER